MISDYKIKDYFSGDKNAQLFVTILIEQEIDAYKEKVTKEIGKFMQEIASIKCYTPLEAEVQTVRINTLQKLSERLEK